jgi:hypothetical protein
MNKIIRKEENSFENIDTMPETRSDTQSDILIDSSAKSEIKEGFDGIRKSNARIIFCILLGIIILDFAYECCN